MLDRQPESPLSITREEVQQLPLARYDGPIHLIGRQQPCADACQILARETVLGFDTESRPSFRRGQNFLPSLIQFATRNEVFLFQIGNRHIPDEIIAVLENPGIVKAGLALQQDFSKLRQIRAFQEGGMVDLSRMAAKKGIKTTGLRSLAALFLKIRVSKGAQVTNWSKDELTPAQIQYAAVDAWISRELYFKLQESPQ
ncbi:MAG: 3'-5' exonuclease domain-containing protein 2 [Methylacidiphilales bacterium]|nr:3'-5' exonuclease domain-containing protein 2 [Candidatus Methylacidiphilales bacterium]